MAIIFTKSLSEINVLNAYNNNIVIFNSDNILDSKKCNINIGTYNFEITPLNNVFEYNFKEVISVLINNNFEDNISPLLVITDASSHIYNDTGNTFINQIITFTITFSDNTTEQITKTYNWLKSVEQLEQNKVGVVTSGNGIYALSPFKKATADTYNITYFEGYPFDISFYLKTTGNVIILNTTNALSYNFTFPNTINRLFFSDGRITITIDDYLPLVDGLNKLKITSGTDIIYINLTKVPSIDGEYVKWINQYGGWNYWLFNCIHKRDNKTKNLGIINNDFNDVGLTTSPFFSLGKTSQNTLTLIANNINENDQEVINQIFESPKVYYFTGLNFTQVTDYSWLSCEVKTGNNNIVDYKKKLKNYKVQLELPNRYTMKL